MHIRYNIEKLGRIMNDLSVLTGISLAFLDCDYNRLCGSIKENDFCEKIQTDRRFFDKCICSDSAIIERCKETKCFESHICYAGLYDAVLPVLKDGVIAGFVIMGRVRSESSPENCLTTEDEEMKRLYKELPYFSKEQLESLRSLLLSILFADAINVEPDALAVEIAEYIARNLTENLSINSLCEKFYISKNFLYKYFDSYYSTTVNEYITSVRIKEAERLLTKTNEPIISVCAKAGIGNYTYFCKLFKKRNGLTPAAYRKYYSK